MNIKTFIKSVSMLPPHIAVLAKGSTGVGKSHIFHQIAKGLGLPIIDRRLAQMTEGDLIGLPKLEDEVTRFFGVDWFIRACNEPVVLFLDELNRATPEVQQCAFQIVLDRELNGNKLHPETRVFAAINEGASYQVNEMGPALKRRFWVSELIPTVDDWLVWAKSTGNIDPLMIAFIDKERKHLNYEGANFEPGKVYPTPASWHRFDETLKHCKREPYKLLNDEEYAEGVKFIGNKGRIPEGFLALGSGFIGEEAADTFLAFIEDYENAIKATDILNNYKKIKNKLEALTHDRHASNVENIIDWLSTNEVTIPQSKNGAAYILELPKELLTHFFSTLLRQSNRGNTQKFNKILNKPFRDAVEASHKNETK